MCFPQAPPAPQHVVSACMGQALCHIVSHTGEIQKGVPDPACRREREGNGQLYFIVVSVRKCGSSGFCRNVEEEDQTEARVFRKSTPKTGRLKLGPECFSAFPERPAAVAVIPHSR